jgi:hypothetical protein
MEARKQMYKKKKGDYEFQKWHVIPVKIDEEKLKEVCSYWDDNEDAYLHGVAIGFDDEIVYITVDELLTAIEERIEDEKDECGESDNDLIEIQKALKKYKGYTIWF